jgi:hypothetical protein
MFRSYDHLQEEIALDRNPEPEGQTRKYGRRDTLRWTRDILYPQNLALTSLTSGGRSVGIVRSRTKATEFSFSLNAAYINVRTGLP